MLESIDGSFCKLTAGELSVRYRMVPLLPFTQSGSFILNCPIGAFVYSKFFFFNFFFYFYYTTKRLSIKFTFQSQMSIVITSIHCDSWQVPRYQDRSSINLILWDCQTFIKWYDCVSWLTAENSHFGDITLLVFSFLSYFHFTLSILKLTGMAGPILRVECVN